MMLICGLASCWQVFDRAATGSPARYCSKACRNRALYLTTSTRPRRRKPTEEERRARFLAYQRAYSQRPERRAAAAARGRVRYATEKYKASHRERMQFLWRTDPEYRERQKLARRNLFAGIEIPAPYTGHRWLEMARQAVGAQNLDSSTQWADDYHDDMGEAVLALLEGRDMKQAVKDYRKREYAPRRLTTHLGDWGDDPDKQARWFEKIMPTVASAEDEAVARETATYYLKTPYHHGSNGRASGPKRLSQPSRRRMKDAGWEKHANGRGQEVNVA